MTPKLTQNQQVILDAITQFISENGYSPVMRELCEMTGKKSPATVFNTVCILEQKGYVKTTPGKNRSIRLNSTNPVFTMVVPCKECKHRQKTFNGIAVWDLCHKLNRKTDDDFFCAYGEVKG